MNHLDHEEIVTRYLHDVMRTPDRKALPRTERRMRRLVHWGETLFSWGTHFPLVVPVRRKAGGKVIAWCINGDTWSGSSGWSNDNSTSNHQRAVRKAIAASGMPHVTIPFAALRSAGIDPTTVIPVHVTEDTYEDKSEDYDADDPRISWHYREQAIPGTDGWVNRTTGQWVPRGWDPEHSTWISSPPGRPRWAGGEGYEEYRVAYDKWERQWEDIPQRTQRTGHRTPQVKVGRRVRDVEAIWEDGRMIFTRTWQRHWLGESLVKARLSYRARVRCDLCHGAKSIAPWIDVISGRRDDELPLGPLDEHHQWRMDRNYLRDDGTWALSRYAWPIIATRYRTGCHRCRESGRITVTKQRWAYFLSGFDANEPRPSYFFTELPPKVRPTTVSEAYDTLKPATVALAEEMGRTVHRQGDCFMIETPSVTLRELKQRGGVHLKRTGHTVVDGRMHMDDTALFGTNHTASEMVRLGELTYVRGIIRHEPQGRRPDHVNLNVGKTWSLALPNLTPVGTGA